MTDVIETLHEVKQSCEDLEASLQGTVKARLRFDQAVEQLAGMLGTWQVSAPALQLPAAPAQLLPAAETPAPERETKAARRETIRARTETKPAPAPRTAGLACYRLTEGRDAGPCRGEVELVRCDRGDCTWSRALCAAHREGGREAMARSAHVRVAHKAGGKAAMKALQDKAAAGRRKGKRRAKAARDPEDERDARGRLVPRSHLIAKRARELRQTSGDPRPWRDGRVPELVRCQLPDAYNPKVPCGALVLPAEREQHLVDVHPAVKPSSALLADAFALNNAAGRDNRGAED